MRTLQKFVSVLAGILAAASIVTPVHAQESIAIASRFAEVNGTRLRYLIAGKGEPVLLLHGYAQTSHMWRPLIAELAKTHTVVAPDLRGFGDSAKPESGYDKKTMAQDVHALAMNLGYKRVGIAGHDIGLMVAYAYAAQFPSEVGRIALMDAFLPGVGDWTSVWLLRDLWHFHFYGKTPLALVDGRERIYFEHFWNDFAADPVAGARIERLDCKAVGRLARETFARRALQHAVDKLQPCLAGGCGKLGCERQVVSLGRHERVKLRAAVLVL